MKQLKHENQRISSILAFLLIPLSGLAIDIYIPSFPEMAIDLGTSADNIKLTMTIYLLSYGVSQLFVGMLLDSFGRYNIHIASLLVFVLTCVVIALTSDIYLIFLMRFIQGLAISFITVAKRALFIDIFTGDKRKHYTSMLTVVWSTAPIVAPFVGGYLQTYFGWHSNFILMAIYAALMLLLELRYSGETIVVRQKLSLQSIVHTYRTLLADRGYSIGIMVLGLSYAMVMVFGMSMPFIVEHKLHLSPIVTGYSTLASGVAIFFGGFLSKKLVDKPLYKKLWLANIFQLIAVTAMLITADSVVSLLYIGAFAIVIHFWQGFTYNSYFTFALTRFPEYAATSSGLASGGSYILFSFFSYMMVSNLTIDSQFTLGISYLVFIVTISATLMLLGLTLRRGLTAG
ncbi:MFS transporter [Sphingobacterium sp. Mn56C]|uniref:MFS transporter n=1 Tax=Sphingobacterium sp. Mn56C TaxID=3395261 RepID=UPI003BD7D531